jgi:hypothetical protein
MISIPLLLTLLSDNEIKHGYEGNGVFGHTWEHATDIADLEPKV